MKNLFYFKGSLHRLINYLFYFIVFIFGYLLGGGKIEKIFDFMYIIF